MTGRRPAPGPPLPLSPARPTLSPPPAGPRLTLRGGGTWLSAPTVPPCPPTPCAAGASPEPSCLLPLLLLLLVPRPPRAGTCLLLLGQLLSIAGPGQASRQQEEPRAGGAGATWASYLTSLGPFTHLLGKERQEHLSSLPAGAQSRALPVPLQSLVTAIPGVLWRFRWGHGQRPLLPLTGEDRRP